MEFEDKLEDLENKKEEVNEELKIQIEKNIIWLNRRRK